MKKSNQNKTKTLHYKLMQITHIRYEGNNYLRSIFQLVKPITVRSSIDPTVMLTTDLLYIDLSDLESTVKIDRKSQIITGNFILDVEVSQDDEAKLWLVTETFANQRLEREL